MFKHRFRELHNYYTKAEQIRFFSDFWIIFLPLPLADACSFLHLVVFVFTIGCALQFMDALIPRGFPLWCLLLGGRSPFFTCAAVALWIPNVW
jgi:hypothetical protein